MKEIIKEKSMRYQILILECERVEKIDGLKVLVLKRKAIITINKNKQKTKCATKWECN